MANNTQINTGSGDIIRTIDRAGVKTDVAIIDRGGSASEDLGPLYGDTASGNITGPPRSRSRSPSASALSASRSPARSSAPSCSRVRSTTRTSWPCRSSPWAAPASRSHPGHGPGHLADRRHRPGHLPGALHGLHVGHGGRHAHLVCRRRWRAADGGAAPGQQPDRLLGPAADFRRRSDGDHHDCRAWRTVLSRRARTSTTLSPVTPWSWSR
jgi:hypothetical protein